MQDRSPLRLRRFGGFGSMPTRRVCVLARMAIRRRHLLIKIMSQMKAVLLWLCLCMWMRGAVAQVVTATWQADGAITTTTSIGQSSLPSGAFLQDGASVPGSHGGTYFGVTNSRLATTYRISQSLVSSFFGTFGFMSSGGATLLVLKSDSPATCSLSLEFGLSGLLIGNVGSSIGAACSASVDSGNDGTIEWSYSGASIPGSGVLWSGTVTFSGTYVIGIRSSYMAFLFDSGYGNMVSSNLRLRVDPCVHAVGAGSPVAAGTPSIAPAGGAPTIGNSFFRVTGTNCLPNDLAALLVAVGPLAPSPGLQVPDAQPGCLVHVPLGQHLCFVVLSDSAGRVSQPLGIPSDPYFVGLRIGAQWLARDMSLAYPIAIGTSPALAFQLSN